MNPGNANSTRVRLNSFYQSTNNFILRCVRGFLEQRHASPGTILLFCSQPDGLMMGVVIMDGRKEFLATLECKPVIDQRKPGRGIWRKSVSFSSAARV